VEAVLVDARRAKHCLIEIGPWTLAHANPRWLYHGLLDGSYRSSKLTVVPSSFGSKSTISPLGCRLALERLTPWGSTDVVAARRANEQGIEPS
jgi:hypothetical protein